MIQYIIEQFLFFTFLFLSIICSFNLSSQTFAVIGDYGSDDLQELDVSNLVHSWNPDFVITTGDNNYTNGDSATMDKNIGKYYHDYIYPYKGNYGAGATANRFFPSLGNHDIIKAKGKAYFNYFELPGNERYYDYVKGNVHFFVLNSNLSEPDGATPDSIQGKWLKNALAISTSKWKIVYFHHPPYSSGRKHGDALHMQWPFKEWGATAIISAHEHNYERLIVNGFPCFVNGLGGNGINLLKDSITGSIVRYDKDQGAMLVNANSDSIVFKFINRLAEQIDYYSIVSPMIDSIICGTKAHIAASGAGNFCQGDSIILTSSSGTNYLWSPGGQTTESITIRTSGNYKVMLSQGNHCMSSDSSNIIVYSLPQIPSIIKNGDSLISSSEIGNQWFLNDSVIPGAMHQGLKATRTGHYAVLKTDSNGCSAKSDTVSFFVEVNVSIEAEMRNNRLKVYPNPASQAIIVEYNSEGHKNILISLLNSNGKIVYKSAPRQEEHHGDFYLNIDVSKQPKGIYCLRIEMDKEMMNIKIVLN